VRGGAKLKLVLEGADVLFDPAHVLVVVTAETGLFQGQVLGNGNGFDVELMGGGGCLVDLAGVVAPAAGDLGLGKVEAVVVNAVARSPAGGPGHMAVATAHLLRIVFRMLLEMVEVAVVTGLAIFALAVVPFLRILRSGDASDAAGSFF